MKIIEGFKMRDVAGQKVIVGEGLKQIDFNRLISLNESAAYIWSEIEGKVFDVQTIADLLTTKYDIDETSAKSDAKEFLEQWKKEGLIEN